MKKLNYCLKYYFLGYTAEQLSSKLDIPVKKLTKRLDKLSKSGIIFRSERPSEVRYSLYDSLFIFYQSLGCKGKKDKLNREISPYLNKYYFKTYAKEFVGQIDNSLIL